MSLLLQTLFSFFHLLRRSLCIGQKSRLHCDVEAAAGAHNFDDDNPESRVLADAEKTRQSFCVEPHSSCVRGATSVFKNRSRVAFPETSNEVEDGERAGSDVSADRIIPLPHSVPGAMKSSRPPTELASLYDEQLDALAGGLIPIPRAVPAAIESSEAASKFGDNFFSSFLLDALEGGVLYVVDGGAEVVDGDDNLPLLQASASDASLDLLEKGWLYVAVGGVLEEDVETETADQSLSTQEDESFSELDLDWQDNSSIATTMSEASLLAELSKEYDEEDEDEEEHADARSSVIDPRPNPVPKLGIDEVKTRAKPPILLLTSPSDGELPDIDVYPQGYPPFVDYVVSPPFLISDLPTFLISDTPPTGFGTLASFASSLDLADLASPDSSDDGVRDSVPIPATSVPAFPFVKPDVVLEDDAVFVIGEDDEEENEAASRTDWRLNWEGDDEATAFSF
ncbi:hypothetical protein MKEN_00034000 [Mycena kentingensis (nom. inval.)]|nr:hypothetical protein MKEN_00034000 [Mycena kentingensis (nom. inval.)]